MPAATQDGKNTAGCLINGEAFVPKLYGGSLFNAPIPALEGGFYFDSLYYLSLNGQGISITLFLRRPKPGAFLLNLHTQFYPQGVSLYMLNHATYRISGAAGAETYVTNARHTGRVELTKADKLSGLSAGTFSCLAVSNRDLTKPITIKNGRFNRKQQPLSHSLFSTAIKAFSTLVLLALTGPTLAQAPAGQRCSQLTPPPTVSIEADKRSALWPWLIRMMLSARPKPR